MIHFTSVDDDGVETEHELPSKFEVCDTCRGHGKRVDPNIDGDGLTAEDFAEDPDFEESYFAGHYDVTCDECGGRRVVEVVDETSCTTPELKAALTLYFEHIESEARWAQEDAYVRRMGF